MSLMKIKQEVVCIFTLLSGCVLDTKCTFRDELAVHQQTGVAEAEHIVLFIYSVVVSLHSLAFQPHVTTDFLEKSGYSGQM